MKKDKTKSLFLQHFNSTFHFYPLTGHFLYHLNSLLSQLTKAWSWGHMPSTLELRISESIITVVETCNEWGHSFKLINTHRKQIPEIPNSQEI